MPSYPRLIRAGVIAAAVIAAWAPSSGEAADPPNRVVLQVFQVKVVDSAGKPGQIPITFYIDAPNSRGAQAICSVGPRVRDALNTHLRKDTYQMDKQNKLDTVAIAEKARPVIEDAVKKENVTGVLVSMDPPKISAAGQGMFARLGCIGAADQDEKKSAAKKK